jgi:hypothetical protein
VRVFLSVITRIIAPVFTFFFVVTTILAIFLTTINQHLFDTSIYKNALIEQNVYERLPEIVGVTLTSSYFRNSCAQNPLACSIDNASPELQACLMTTLGQAAYQAIGSGQRNPTDVELKLAQPCLDQFGSPQTANRQSEPGQEPGKMLSFFHNLTAANWQDSVTILLPPDILKTMTESTLDQLFTYLNGETDTVTVPLEKLKERLAGQAGSDLFLQLLNSQPPCTEQDVEQLFDLTGNGGMVLCKPPEVILPILTFLLPELLNLIVQQIPDKAIIISPPAVGTPTPDSNPFGTDPVTTIHTIRLVMQLSFLFPLAFLLLVTLFRVRSIKSWMRWWGIPVFISGTITLMLRISALPILNTAWTIFIVPKIPPFIPADMTGIGLVLLRSIFHSMTSGIVLWAITLLATGLGAWTGSYFIKKKNYLIDPDVQAQPPAPSS